MATVKRMKEAELAAMVALLRGPMRTTWQVIGGDIEQACAEGGERLNNKVAVEATLDANYMSTYAGDAGKAADVALTVACKAGHYRQIYNRLCKEVQLY